jgi:hypothetical protein
VAVEALAAVVVRAAAEEGVVMPGVAILVRHALADELEHRGTWTFDAAGGGPTYATGGIAYTAAMFGYQTLSTMRVDAIAVLAGAPWLVYHDYGLQKVKFFNPGTGAEMAAATSIAPIQLAWAGRGR